MSEKRLGSGRMAADAIQRQSGGAGVCCTEYLAVAHTAVHCSRLAACMHSGPVRATCHRQCNSQKRKARKVRPEFAQREGQSVRATARDEGSRRATAGLVPAAAAASPPHDQGRRLPRQQCHSRSLHPAAARSGLPVDGGVDARWCLLSAWPAGAATASVHHNDGRRHQRRLRVRWDQHQLPRAGSAETDGVRRRHHPSSQPRDRPPHGRSPAGGGRGRVPRPTAAATPWEDAPAATGPRRWGGGMCDPGPARGMPPPHPAYVTDVALVREACQVSASSTRHTRLAAGKNRGKRGRSAGHPCTSCRRRLPARTPTSGGTARPTTARPRPSITHRYRARRTSAPSVRPDRPCRGAASATRLPPHPLHPH